jgi:pyrroloquinoline quinone biosynthesis protein D
MQAVNFLQHTLKFMTLHLDLPISFSPMHRLQWEDAQQKFVILYPEGMVELNQSSAEILKLCDGTRTFSQLVTDLETLFQTTGLENDVATFIEVAFKNGWITQG